MLQYTFYTISTVIITYALLMGCPSSRSTVLKCRPSRTALPPPLRTIATAPTHQPWLLESTPKWRPILQTNKRRRCRRVRQYDNIALPPTCQGQHTTRPNLLSSACDKVGQWFRHCNDGRIRRFWPSHSKNLHGCHSNGHYAKPSAQ